MADRYAFDANIVILMNRYTPPDIYVSLWQQVEALVAEGRLCMPRMAYEEVTRIDDYCAPWARGQSGFIVEADDAEIALVAEITAAHPGWVQDQTNAADPWLVAHAATKRRVLVTDETRKGLGTIDTNLKIPNVADEHNVECINLNELGRREIWRF